MKSWKDNIYFILVEPKEATKRIIKAAKKNKVAILFGREKNGLTNQEVEECGFLITIPSNPLAFVKSCLKIDIDFRLIIYCEKIIDRIPK
jgi:tRNA(Leu) C34 or U34 (ribose-2'-O)-methylase TrmL